MKTEKMCFRCDGGKGHRMLFVPDRLGSGYGDKWFCFNCGFIVHNGKKAKGVLTFKIKTPPKRGDH